MDGSEMFDSMHDGDNPEDYIGICYRIRQTMTQGSRKESRIAARELRGPTVAARTAMSLAKILARRYNAMIVPLSKAAGYRIDVPSSGVRVELEIEEDTYLGDPEVTSIEGFEVYDDDEL
jgi:hypothetical protein